MAEGPVGPPFRRAFDAARSPRDAANALQLQPGVHVVGLDNGHVELAEIANPAAPVTNRARLFVRDNGAGKTQLCVRFPTGAIQVLATEP